MGSNSDSSSGSLRFVDLAGFVPQEEIEERRVDAIFARIQRDGRLKHPPLVSDLPDGRFTIFDGNGPAAALARFGFRSILAQIVNPRDISAQTWVLKLPAASHTPIDDLRADGLVVAATSDPSAEMRNP